MSEVIIRDFDNVKMIVCKDLSLLSDMKKQLTFKYVGNLPGNRGFAEKVESLVFSSHAAMTDMLGKDVLKSNADYFFTYHGFLKFLTDWMDRNQVKYTTIRDRTCGYYPSDELTDLSVLDDISLRAYQGDVINAIMSNTNGRIICPTGFGKSFLIAVICAIYNKARIVVVTPSNAVLKTLYASISSIAGYGSVGLMSSVATRKERNSSARIICVSGKSLHQVRFKPDIILADEIHEMCTDAYRADLSNQVFSHSRVYGFSANSVREDKRHYLMRALFGPILYKVSYTAAVKAGLIVPIRVLAKKLTGITDVVAAKSYGRRWNKMSNVMKEKTGIWRHDNRNTAIANMAREWSDKTQTLVVSKTLEHALYLKQLLPEFTLIYRSIDAVSYDYFRRQGLLPEDFVSMTPRGFDSIMRRFRNGELDKVIATTVWNRGVDFPALGVVIRADAASSIASNTQIPGRVSRLYAEKHEGIVIDVIDAWNPTFNNRSLKRLRDYKSFEWKVDDYDTYMSEQFGS